MLPLRTCGDIIDRMQDRELLRAYVVNKEETAFAELVRRYVDLVFATALRHFEGNAQSAEEVTQTVFLLLARKAGSLVNHPILAGWLHQTTCHIAAKTRRAEKRRRARENAAVQMNMNDPDDPGLERILPLLDEALNTLSESDRLAVLLRYFQKKPMREIGQAFGVSEAAAKMRVSRAVDRLREFFARRGVVCPAATVSAILSEKAVTAAPQTLASSVMSHVTKLGGAGMATHATTELLILMSQAKAKTILLAGAAILAVFTGSVYHFKTQRNSELVVPERAEAAAAPNDRQVTGSQTPALGTADFGAAPGYETAAAERLRAVLTAREPRGRSVIWPDEDVLRVMAAFTDRAAAFEILRAAAAHPSELLRGAADVEDLEYLVRLRAIMSMAQLAQDVEEVVPFLREQCRSGDITGKMHAFSALKAIGFKAEDVPGLVAMLPEVASSPAMRRYLPQAIADVISEHPEDTVSSVAALERLLEHPEESIRFSAAAALVTARLQDERVSEALGNALANPDSFEAGSAVEALAKAGSSANAFVPALLDLAQNTRQKYVRTNALRVAASIQPGLLEARPDVAQVMAADAFLQDVNARLNSGAASLEDLMTALRFPQHALTAASQLGDLGPAAHEAVPSLLGALQGKDEETRERILEFIYRIDPLARLERVEAPTIMHGVLAADLILGDRSHDHQDPITKIILEGRMHLTWWTKAELVSFAKKLAGLDPAVHRGFVEGILEKDPALRDVLQTPAQP
jgi:RNA polymerase sigma factor (sigma-70 family)